MGPAATGAAGGAAGAGAAAAGGSAGAGAGAGAGAAAAGSSCLEQAAASTAPLAGTIIKKRRRVVMGNLLIYGWEAGRRPDHAASRIVAFRATAACKRLYACPMRRRVTACASPTPA